MPWCPECKTEYRHGFHVCSDCGVELVKDLEPDYETKGYINDEWKLFIQTHDETEADVIKSILDSYHIPILRKDRGAGGYLKIYMGMTHLGINIYVPDSRFAEAKEIIANIKPQEDARKEDVKNVYRLSNPYRKKQQHRTILLFVIIPFLMWFLVFIARHLF